MRTTAQIFVAFSEKLNFKTGKLKEKTLLNQKEIFVLFQLLKLRKIRGRKGKESTGNCFDLRNFFSISIIDLTFLNISQIVCSVPHLSFKPSFKMAFSFSECPLRVIQFALCFLCVSLSDFKHVGLYRLFFLRLIARFFTKIYMNCLVSS